MIFIEITNMFFFLQNLVMAARKEQVPKDPQISKVSVNSNVYSSPYCSYGSDDFYRMPSSPPPTKEEELRIKAEKDKYLENDAQFPHCENANKYKIIKKIGQGTFGSVCPF